MDRIEAYKIIDSCSADLFPNNKYSEEEVENAVMQASPVMTNYTNSGIVKNCNIAFVLSLIFGFWGAGMLYIGEVKRVIFRFVLYFVFGAMLIIPTYYIAYVLNEEPESNPVILILLGIFLITFITTLIIDILQTKNICRANNCKRLMNLAEKYTYAEQDSFVGDNTVYGTDNDKVYVTEDLDDILNDYKG